MGTEDRIRALKGKLIVSCQALPQEPLHSSFIMGRMARAAKEGGAAGIRANTKEDIKEIQEVTGLPVIGIVKRDYPDSAVYITPTMKEIEELMEVKPEIIAIDATGALRPGNVTLAPQRLSASLHFLWKSLLRISGRNRRSIRRRDDSLSSRCSTALLVSGRRPPGSLLDPFYGIPSRKLS